MANQIPGYRVISGSHGYLWKDGVPIYESTGWQAKIAKQKEDEAMCGAYIIDQKANGGKGTGNIDSFKVYSPDAAELANLKSGVDDRFTLVMALKDPQAYGYERVALYNCSFDDITLADFATGKSGTVSRPFTFTDFEFLDRIER